MNETTLDITIIFTDEYGSICDYRDGSFIEYHYTDIELDTKWLILGIKSVDNIVDFMVDNNMRYFNAVEILEKLTCALL